MPAMAGRPSRRAAMRVIVRWIWATPSEAQAPGSVTISARSAAKRPLMVSRPSEGGQSMTTRS